jgi:hypothetical protein
MAERTFSPFVFTGIRLAGGILILDAEGAARGV